MHVAVSPETSELLDAAATLSARRALSFVGIEHLFEAVVARPDLLPEPVIGPYLAHLTHVAAELAGETWRGTMPPTTGEVFYTPRCAETMRMAARLGQGSGQPPAAGHLLLAILADAHAAPSRLMDQLALPRGDMIAALRSSLGGHTPGAAGPKPARRNLGAPAQPVPASLAAAPRPDERPGFSLESLTRDLSAAARNGTLEPAVGRDKEIFHLLEVLARRNKNNAILVGEAGVGKTRVVEGLARTVAAGRAKGIPDYRVLELNLAALMAGTQYRGGFEERLLALLDELKGAPDTILFIDEIHLIMGAGATEGGAMDLANLLKPPLARGEIRCIGATTLHEYRRFIEKDPAIERRFQLIRVEPLTPSATWDVLNRLRPSLEEHHGVRISRRALHAAIALSEQYMPQRHLPDKAIDVLDQACARYRLKAVAAVSNPAAFDSDPGTPVEAKVTPHDIRRVISRITSVPIEEITAEERKRLGSLERKLNRRIIGQEEAVSRVIAAVKKARAGLGNPNRPDAVMLFLGPTGVGKTQLAKALADGLFGSPQHLITFDMSEYTERHSVSRLIGAPPGYVGSDEEGRLTGSVRHNPFTILLFDEIEKAHRDLFDVFLPMLDEGRVKDNRGRDVNFRNCIIIFTSNIAAELPAEALTDPARGALMAELRRHFRPEFINRIDEIVPFHRLLAEDIRRILQRCLADLQSRLNKRGIDLHVYQGAYEHLAEAGYSAEYGARELQRTVDRLVVNPISAMILEDRIRAGDCARVLVKDGQLTIAAAHVVEGNTGWR
ncbi:MAG: ATP-dependent Clp protease ATP-binding subunit [Candidatus Hydrogenedentes bacterium]|nr:ATP-dependent Clp protease ATP-binding subunit [Candidatus Hydrogenedentota bacterium]